MTLLDMKLGLLLVGLTTVGAFTASADAAVVVRAPTFTTAGGGSYDVPVQFTASESPFAISGYYIDLRVTRTSGTGTLSLTGGGVAATNPVGLTPMFFATPAATPPGGNFNADNSSSTFSVSNGTGLLSATYSVTGTGTFELSFVTSGGGDVSNLYNAVTDDAVPAISFATGTITVVPEPTLVGVASVLTGALLLRRRAH